MENGIKKKQILLEEVVMREWFAQMPTHQQMIYHQSADTPTVNFDREQLYKILRTMKDSVVT